jgi:hypothetical protein
MLWLLLIVALAILIFGVVGAIKISLWLLLLILLAGLIVAFASSIGRRGRNT